MRGEGLPQDRFALGELEGDICVGITWGLRGNCVGIGWGRLAYKGSLYGEGVLRTGLHGDVSASRASLRGADMFKFCVRTKHTIFSPLGYIKMRGDYKYTSKWVGIAWGLRRDEQIIYT